MVTKIPENPDFHGSTAEAAVWNALVSQLPSHTTVLHSQRITGEGKDVEIDFLVLWPNVGIAVIEVKGGTVETHDGQWFSRNSKGYRNRLKASPLHQAMVAKHTLVKYLRARLTRMPGPICDVAVLPYTQLAENWDMPDAPRDRLIDSTQLKGLADSLAMALKRSYDPDRDDLFASHEHVVKNLQRTNDAIENVRIAAAHIADKAEELTRDQERLISMLRLQNRAEISGGPGTGKTHLALIKARALTRDGYRVALMCYSRGLGQYLQMVTAKWPEGDRPEYVGLFHNLPLMWGAEPGTDDDSDYWEHRLPQRLRELADDRPRSTLFDAIVVDEGQDFSVEWWEAVQSCLRNQVEGTLYVFTDERQTIFDRTGEAPITMNPIQLDENLRNSQEIVEVFAQLADEQPIIRNAKAGEVEWWNTDCESAVSYTDEQIEKLLSEGWAKGDIALLTTGTRHPVQKEIVESEGYGAYWDEFFAGKDVFYGHVLGFKGLERPVVVLSVNGFHDERRAAELLYVGMSRATTKLVVVGDLDFIGELKAQS